MTTDTQLTALYERELAFLRHSGNTFAERHPKIAARLRTDGENVEDPHVSRLLEGFAFLNARIQQKLHDDLPEITDAFLETLYPHLTRPLPAMSIAKFDPKASLDETTCLDRHTELETDAVNGQNCRFRTCYTTHLSPLRITQAQLTGSPLLSPGAERIRGAQSALHLQLRTLSEKQSIKETGLTTLRLYLPEQGRSRYELYELLMNDCVKIVASSGQDTPACPVFLSPNAIKPVGFSPEESLLPYPASVSQAHRLLLEYFAFEEKFFFIDIELPIERIPTDQPVLDLYFYFSSQNVPLERELGTAHFAMGCTPIVNLFQKTAEPIPLTHEQSDYLVVPDARAIEHTTIFSIDQVSLLDNNSETHHCHPCYGLNHHQKNASTQQNQQTLFWHAQRGQDLLNPDAVTIRMIDLDLNVFSTNTQTVAIETTCCNGQLPHQLPFGGHQLKLSLVEASIEAESITCLTAPTPMTSPSRGDSAHWRLIAQLHHNHLNFSDATVALERLKEILVQHNLAQSPSHQAQIDAIDALDCRLISAPIMIDGRHALCRGHELNLTLNPTLFSGSSLYLFAAILERFFGLYCAINSFTKLTIYRQAETHVFKSWAPRSGEQTLI